MRQINLLPSELGAREVKQRTIPFVVIAVAAGIAAVVFPWLALKQVNSSISNQVAKRQLQVGLVVVPQNVAANEAQTAALADTTNRISILNTLAKSEIDWQRVFDLVQASIPKDVVLTSYHVAVAGTTTTLDISGTAPSNLSFASFIDSLKVDTHYTVFVVDGFSYNATDGSVVFSITATINPADIEFNTPSWISAFAPPF